MANPVGRAEGFAPTPIQVKVHISLKLEAPNLRVNPARNATDVDDAAHHAPRLREVPFFYLLAYLS